MMRRLLSSAAPRKSGLKGALEAHGRSWLVSTHGVLLAIAALAVTVLALQHFQPSDATFSHSEYVSISGNCLELHCRPFYVAGFNTHDLVQNAMISATDYSTTDQLSGDQMVAQLIRTAQSAQLNVVRTWAHTNHPDFPFQKRPGEYDPRGFKALDLVVETCRRRGLKLILSLIDNWKYYNGVDQYLDWSQTMPDRTQKRPADTNGDPTPLTYFQTHGKSLYARKHPAHAHVQMYQSEAVKRYEVRRHAAFFTDAHARRMYMAHAAALLNRVNSYSGLQYRDDPTILGWDLLNEPRCETWLVPGCAAEVQAWLEEMAPFVKGLAPRQLVLVGSEGFFASDSPEAAHNPQEWAAQMGQNFSANSRTPGVDVAGLHVWPNNWERTSDAFLLDWLRSHTRETARAVRKPLLLEEFGKALAPMERGNAAAVAAKRDHVFRLTYDAVWEQIEAGSAVIGTLFWRWGLPMFSGEGHGDYGVDPKDSTFGIITEHARRVNARINATPPRAGCGYECWVPATRLGMRACKRDQAACDAHWAAAAAGEAPAGGAFFPSKAHCCRPGLGAYGRGCSWLAF